MFQNAQRAVDAGVAERLDLRRLSKDNIRDMILKVFRSSYYRERIRFKSNLVKDTPVKPLDNAIWWIEWLMRHPDKNYLRSPVLKMGQFKANLYDLLTYFYLFTIILTIFLTRKYYLRQTKSHKIQNHSGNSTMKRNNSRKKFDKSE